MLYKSGYFNLFILKIRAIFLQKNCFLYVLKTDLSGQKFIQKKKKINEV